MRSELKPKDSLLEFIRFAKGNATLYQVMGLFAPIILYNKLIKKDGEQAKRMVLSFLFKGEKESDLKVLGESFSRKVIPEIIRKETMESLADLKKHGYKIVVISASVNIWLKPWTDMMDMELI